MVPKFLNPPKNFALRKSFSGFVLIFPGWDRFFAPSINPI